MGSVSSSCLYYSHAGGLIGYALDIKIVNSYATGEVSFIKNSSSTYSHAGGLVGYVYGNSVPTMITNSYATGSVFSSSTCSWAGGLVGYAYGYGVPTMITNSYATGEVSSSGNLSSRAGGFVGFLEDGTITNSYAMGSISSTHAEHPCAGGLVGSAAGVTTVNNSYWNGDDGNPVNALGSGTFAEGSTCSSKTSDEMTSADFAATLNSDAYIAWAGHTPTFKAGRTGIIEANVSDNENLWNLLQSWVETPSDDKQSNVDYANWMAYRSGTGNDYESPSFLPIKVNIEIGSDKDSATAGDTVNFSASISWKELISQNLIKSICEKSSSFEITDPDGETSQVSGASSTIEDEKISLNFSHEFTKPGDHTIKFIYQGDNVFKADTVTKSISVSGSDTVGGNESATTAKFLKEINVDNAKVNDSTKWSNLVDSKKVDEIKRSYNSYSEENPLMINSAAELAAFAAVVNSSTEEEKWDFEGKYVKMGCDIDLEGSGLTSTESDVVEDGKNKFTITYEGTVEKAWNPIGISEDKAFKGTFDGGSHEIKNMVVLEKSNDNDVYAGLFGCADGATIKNLGISKGSYAVVSSSYETYTGGLVGNASDATIINSYAVGTVSSSSCSYSYAGGLVGYVYGNSVPTMITNSYATGSVFSSTTTGSSWAGGLVGEAYGTFYITNSYAVGTVSSSSYAYSYAGGLVGHAVYVAITSSYATGPVSSFSSNNSAYVGGLMGYVGATTKITNSYAVGTVSSSSYAYSYAGGLAGVASGTITSSYAIGSVSSCNASSLSYYSPHSGGLVGNTYGTFNITNSYATGTVCSSYEHGSGGFVGISYGTTTVNNSYWNGDGDNPGDALGEGDLAEGSTYSSKTSDEMTSADFAAALNPDAYIAWAGHTPTFKAGRTGTIEANVSDNENLWNLLQSRVEAESNNDYANWMAYRSSTGNGYESPSFLPIKGNMEVDLEKNSATVGDTVNFSASISWETFINEELISNQDTSSQKAFISRDPINKPNILSLLKFEITDPDGEISRVSGASSTIEDEKISLNFSHEFTKQGDHTIKFIYQGDNVFKAYTVTKSISVSGSDTAGGNESGTTASGSDTAGGNESATTARFLKEINVDNAKVNDGTKWSNLVDSKKVDEIKRSYNSYSEENPLMINSAAELAAFAAVVNGTATATDGTTVGPLDFSDKCVRMNNDIDLEGYGLDCNDPDESVETDDSGNKVFTLTYSGTVENAWNPIGESKATLFKGTFDGGSHEIRNMIVLGKKGVGEVYAGLFGCVDGATIKNLGIGEGSYVAGFSSNGDCHVGGLLGCDDKNSIINNCCATVIVSSSSSSDYCYVGGLVGSVDWSRSGTTMITNSYAMGEVFSSTSHLYSYTGGLVGYSHNATITNSYATGAVSSLVYNYYSSYAGGLVGYSNNGTITTSYATGGVVSSSEETAYAGGLVGYSDKGTITTSYATGGVVSSSEGMAYAGGLVGWLYNNGAITNSYATGGVMSSSKTGAYAGGLAGGIASGTITSSYAIGSVSSSTAYTGGLVGNATVTTTVNNSYWKKEINDNNPDKALGYSGTPEGCSSKTYDEMTKADFAAALNPDAYIAWADHTPTFKAGRTGIIEANVSDNENLCDLLQYWVVEESNKGNSYANWTVNPDGTENPTFLIPEVDNNFPTGKIVIGEQSWMEFSDDIKFNLFFKGQISDISIEATDKGSGVKSTQYIVTDKIYDKDSIKGNDISWKNCTGSISIEELGKNIVYVKITDKANNVTYINSNGLVVYEDATLGETGNLEYTRTSSEDLSVPVNFNGNTVSKITDKNNMTLGAGHTM